MDISDNDFKPKMSNGAHFVDTRPQTKQTKKWTAHVMQLIGRAASRGKHVWKCIIIYWMFVLFIKSNRWCVDKWNIENRKRRHRLHSCYNCVSCSLMLLPFVCFDFGFIPLLLLLLLPTQWFAFFCIAAHYHENRSHGTHFTQVYWNNPTKLR